MPNYVRHFLNKIIQQSYTKIHQFKSLLYRDSSKRFVRLFYQKSLTNHHFSRKAG
jgi:hypothetical protein